MKKMYLFFLAACCSFQLLAQSSAAPQLSPLTRHYLVSLKATGNELVEGVAYKKHANGKIYACALIKVAAAGVAQEQLDGIGAIVGTKAGNIWTVHVPVEKIPAFTTVQGVEYIQLDEPVFPKLDVARKTTRTDSVHEGINLPMPYSGKDVVVGVIDFGFDYNHPTMYDTSGNIYRIKRVWELNATGTPPSGYSYGHEETTAAAIQARGTDNAMQTHGTATTGIAAGSGYGSTPAPDRFRGMAYESDIVLVGVRRDTIGTQWMQGSFTDFIDGVNYIFSYATSVGKPAVINISWGSQSGPHDGSTLFNQACNNLSGPGKLVVMSAGNEGEENIHLSQTFTSADTGLTTYLKFSTSTYKRTWVDVWGEPGKTFCAQIGLCTGNTPFTSTSVVCVDGGTQSFYLLGTNPLDTCYVEFIASPADFNGKPRIIINIFNKTPAFASVNVSGHDGTINMWDEYYFYGYTHGYQSSFIKRTASWASDGNPVSTASDMGSAQSVLLVGAYASKIDFTDINGFGRTYSSYVDMPGKIAPFSSHGPLIDGRIKPDITAPGLTLATAMSSYDTSFTPAGDNSDLTIAAATHLGNTYYYAEFIGTSASSPAAAGIVGLLLQANPNLTPEQLKEALSATAIQDNFTGSLPAGGDNIWGHGKINAYGAMKQVLLQMGVYEFSGKKLDCVLFPNPNDGNATLDYIGDSHETLQVQVLNITGSVVYKDAWTVNKGFNRRSLNLGNLARGTYIVHVRSLSGTARIKTTVQ